MRVSYPQLKVLLPKIKIKKPAKQKSPIPSAKNQIYFKTPQATEIDMPFISYRRDGRPHVLLDCWSVKKISISHLQDYTRIFSPQAYTS